MFLSKVMAILRWIEKFKLQIYSSATLEQSPSIFEIWPNIVDQRPQNPQIRKLTTLRIVGVFVTSRAEHGHFSVGPLTCILSSFFLESLLSMVYAPPLPLLALNLTFTHLSFWHTHSFCITSVSLKKLCLEFHIKCVRYFISLCILSDSHRKLIKLAQLSTRIKKLFEVIL